MASWPVGKAEARRASSKAIRRGGIVAISYCMGSPRNASWLLDSYILATGYYLLATNYWRRDESRLYDCFIRWRSPRRQYTDTAAISSPISP